MQDHYAKNPFGEVWMSWGKVPQCTDDRFVLRARDDNLALQPPPSHRRKNFGPPFISHPAANTHVHTTLAAQCGDDPFAEGGWMGVISPLNTDERFSLSAREEGPELRGLPSRRGIAPRWDNNPALPAIPPAANPHSGLTPGAPCAWCMRHNDGVVTDYAKTYQIVDCVWPSNIGDVCGCPRCNTTDHVFDHCPRMARLTESAKEHETWKFLVRFRGGLPPIRSAQSWPDLAAANTNQSEDGFPATKAHILQQFADDMAAFQDYDHVAKPLPFPSDPATASIAVIRANLVALSASEVYAPVRRPSVEREAGPRTGEAGETAESGMTDSPRKDKDDDVSEYSDGDFLGELL